MESIASKYFPGCSKMMILYFMLLVSYARTQGEDSISEESAQSRSMFERGFARSLGPVDDPFARSIGARHIGNGMHFKAGWRPVMASGSTSFTGDGHKMFTGPALLETKAYNVHGFGVSSFGSTSTRPLITRDVNKLSNIAQTYKPSVFPQNSVNLNAPVNSYLNPFAFTSNAALNPYKISPGYHFDNNVYLKQSTSHRPLYTKQPQQQQLLLGIRVKPGQYQITQQHPNNHQYHPQQPQYQQQIKKPIDSYSRPLDNYNQHQGYPKPEHIIPVNPQESLNKQMQQTKLHSNHGVQAVTYKPPVAARFPQFGVDEDSFAPIPSSILGSFSSFGHASVKARDPPQFGSKNQYQTIEPTKTPEISTVTKEYASSSTVNSEVKIFPKDTKATHSIPQAYKTGTKDDSYKDSLVPPPQINKPVGQTYKNPSTEKNVPYKDNFIPSPLDPLSKGQNNHADSSKFPTSNKYTDKQNKHSNSKRPIVTSFFDSNIISPSTVSPYEAHSTNAVPDNLIVQLPPPNSPFRGVQSSKVIINKDNHQSYSTVSHSPVTTRYNIFEDSQRFPSQEFYDDKYNKGTNPPKSSSYQHSYEVTEGWEPFGEDGTQQPLNSWGNPSQTFKQYTNILGPPGDLNKIVSTFYPPQISTTHPDINAYSDVSTIFSVIPENGQQQEAYSSENSLTSPDPQDYDNSDHSNKQVVISPSPNFINVNTDRSRYTTTDAYQETTTIPAIYNSRRKPSRYRPHHETTTEDFKEVTTRYETYKENAQESSNDLTANDLPTIPPNKHFKRPGLTTTQNPIEEKKNKNRRRRPLKSSSTTVDVDDTPEESVTESIYKSHKDRTTTVLPETEETTTKLIRNRLRFPQKVRPTRPSAQPELTSSAQPTVIPTHPITLRSKLHSRIRTTTQNSLDFDETVETTTVRDRINKVHEKQSSIMKIAKDNLHRPHVIKYSSSFGAASNDAPDYSHKQDEKDTPTSDISLHLSGHKYSAQKEDNLSFSDLFLNLDSEVQPSAQDAFISPTATSQPTEQTETQATQLALNDGKKESAKTSEGTQNNEETSHTSESENKKSKIYGNRPRFSVKDYRNRLNQYTSSSTEKPTHSTESTPRLRFPNRSRFSNSKDAHDSKPSATDIDNATEAPKKKFIPKDSKHKINEINSEKNEKGTLPTTQQKLVNSSSDSEFVSKANNKFRGSLRRDPTKLSISTTVQPEFNEKSKPSLNLKRPSVIRKRVQVTNKPETTVETITEPTVTTEKISLEQMIENVTSTEKSTSETAIMKIAKDDKKHTSTESSVDVDLSQRVADLTLLSSKDYDTPGMFKSVSPNTRRVVPNYFTIATDDPILPIEAFFPQLNQKKDS